MPQSQSIAEYSKLYDQYSNENDYRKVPLIESEWITIKDQSEMENYLPKPNIATITIGISKIQTETISNFESIDVSKSIPNKRAHILNVGGSVWGLDFVPKPSSCKSSDQYLTIGGYNSTTEHHLLTEDVDRNDRFNVIQIWKCRSCITKFKPMLDMCILHDFGVVVDFKWCPYSVYDVEKLGILAAMFNNGEIRLLVVPHPQHVKRARIVLQLSNKNDNAFCFAWGGYRNLACGTRSGSIVIWDIVESLLQDTVLVHVNIPNASLSPIRCIAWKSLFDEMTLFTSDMDGNILLHDLNDPFFPSKIFRVRHTYICLCGPGFGSGFLYGESDGIMRKNMCLTARKSIALTSHNSMIWQCAVSPHHGIMASVGSNGTAMVKPFAHNDIEYTQSHRPAEYTLYELVYDQNSKTFKYIDGIKPKTTFPEREYYNVLSNPIIALQKIAWNTNKNACGWVVSGGAAGLCRLEYTGL
ncbi:hypothetical protein [Parasitella parasitica]|uniref:Uncharacterized protein n=1 Tax=Parasitella parasitica TaxID=35722 RepID=A0A0B7N5X8_9FUNG|nr:hypothetical protein [Parasitella parasitica]